MARDHNSVNVSSDVIVKFGRVHEYVTGLTTKLQDKFKVMVFPFKVLAYSVPCFVLFGDVATVGNRTPNILTDKVRVEDGHHRFSITVIVESVEVTFPTCWRLESFAA